MGIGGGIGRFELARVSYGRLQRFDNLADRIRLHRQADDRPVIVGEGEADRRFLERVLTGETASYFLAGTRNTVVEVSGRAATLKVDRIACVVDRDFDDMIAESETGGVPLVVYDNADLESMLWFSPLLDDVVEELGSSGKLKALGGIDNVRQVVLDAIRPLQRLRRANAVYRWGLPFDTLDIRRKMSITTLTISPQRLCDSLWRAELGVEKRELYEAASSFPEATCPATGQPLVRGRDALAALGVVLRRAAGNLTFQDAQSDRLAEIVRLRATKDAVSSTLWYRDLRTQLQLDVGKQS